MRLAGHTGNDLNRIRDACSYDHPNDGVLFGFAIVAEVCATQSALLNRQGKGVFSTDQYFSWPTLNSLVGAAVVCYYDATPLTNPPQSAALSAFTFV